MRSPDKTAWMRWTAVTSCAVLCLAAAPPAVAQMREGRDAAQPRSSSTNASLSLDDPAVSSFSQKPSGDSANPDASQPGSPSETPVRSTVDATATTLPPRGEVGRGLDRRSDSSGFIVDKTSIVALAIVMVLLIGLVWALRRFVPSLRTVDSDVLNVMARSVLSPKHSLALVRVGRRFVLLGVSGERVTRLSEIDDEEEVAELLARSARGGRTGEAFNDLLAHEARAHRTKGSETVRESAGSRRSPGSGWNHLRVKLRSLKAG